MGPSKFLALCLVALFAAGCSVKRKDVTEDGRTIVSLWVKWEGFEREALESLVREYNESQDSNFVKTLSVSDPKRKVMLATANGHPPDLAFLFYFIIPAYAENNALTPLDSLFDEYGIAKDDFLQSCQDAVAHKGFTWGIPTTATATALHYNKALLKEAGIDIDSPPKTLEALEAMNDRLAVANDDGSLQQIGFLPIEPDWWLSEWGYWFGGDIVHGETMQINQAPWNACANWLASYPERFGAKNLTKLKSGFGGFASSQNPFFTGKVAMVHQGMWMENFVKNYAPPEFEYGIAPMPAAASASAPFVSIVEPDVICIPKGAKHIPEAMDFIQFLLQKENLESLALEQRKLTALKEVSPAFLKNHPHPFIREFQALAASPYSKARPQLTQYEQLQSDMRNAFESIFFARNDVDAAINGAYEKQQDALDKNLKRWNRVSNARIKEWESQ